MRRVPRVFTGCLFLLAGGVVFARVVRETLWISGGAEGLVMGGRVAPGWVGVSRHIEGRGGGGWWMDLDGTRDWDQLAEVEGLRLPDAVAPSEDLLRLRGHEVLTRPAPWTLLNARPLPQFPEYQVPAPPFREWESSHGFRVRVMALLSETTPLRVPPHALRPLWVFDPESGLRERLASDPAPPDRFTAVALPAGADGSHWSKAFPDVRVLIEPAGARPNVIPLEGGRRLRVRPGLHGRAVIRVDIRWDTVARRFRNPHATVEWVRTPDLEPLDFPEDLVQRLRPLPDWQEPDPDLIFGGLADYGNRWLAPDETEPPEEPANALPDARRVALAPTDTVWTRWRLTASERAALARLDLPATLDPLPGGTTDAVLIPSRLAAGNGGDEDWMPLRRFLHGIGVQPDTLPLTSRDLLISHTPPKTTP